jgi:voltage-gated potassium channel
VIPVLAIEYSSASNNWRSAANAVNWAIWVAFFAEAVGYLAFSDNRKQWARTHIVEIGVVLLTPPFLPTTLQALRAVRVLRVLRLVVIAKRIKPLLTPDGLPHAAALTAFTIFGGGVAITRAEPSQHLSLWDGMWWGLTTSTTVGYGDIYPETFLGRSIGAIVMIVGVGFIALLTAAAAQHFLAPDVTEIEEGEQAIADTEIEILERLNTISQRLERLERHIVAGE